MHDAGDGPREHVMGRLRAEIERHVHQSESSDELERVVTAKRDDLRETELELGLLLARRALSGRFSDRYLRTAGESYD